VVDDLNPVLNFTRKEVDSLLHFVEEEPERKSLECHDEFEIVMYQACQLYPHLITKVPLHDGLYLVTYGVPCCIEVLFFFYNVHFTETK